MTRLTIVGSGIAAISAAIESAEKGAQVTIVRGRPGATALSSGAWDIAGCPTRHPGLKWREVPTPAENTLEIVRRRPQHPYALLAQTDEGVVALLEKAIQRLNHPFDFKLRGDLGKNYAVLNPLGGVKFTAFVDSSHAGGNLLEMREARLLILGIRGLPTFFPQGMALFLKELHERQGFPHLASIDSSEITLPLPLSSPIAAAKQLDTDESMESLYKILMKEAERFHPTHVALPPVIGIQKTDLLLSRLREVSGIAWFETLGLPPSVPGLRLQNQIDRLLARFPGEVINGEVVGAVKKGKKVVSIQIQNNEKKEESAVDRLLLATGRYIGGGVVKEKSFREPILDLPLFSEGTQVSEIFVGKLLKDHFLDPHPLFSVGTRTNPFLQPVGERGEVLYENVWVAGSLIGGYNPATDHCGMGVAIGTGTLAGRMASS